MKSQYQVKYNSSILPVIEDTFNPQPNIDINHTKFDMGRPFKAFNLRFESKSSVIVRVETSNGMVMMLGESMGRRTIREFILFLIELEKNN